MTVAVGQQSRSNDLTRLPELAFVKMHGSGNDFVMIDNREAWLRDDQIGLFAQAICRRGQSVGADGIVLVELPSGVDSDFRWRYFNADGSEGEMCGNGAMCAARFAQSLGICSHTCQFDTPSGTVRATMHDDDRVSIAIQDTGPMREENPVEIGGESFLFYSIEVGVPHVVTFVADADSDFDAAGFDEFGSAVRYHSAFAPRGTNVNVVNRMDDGALRMRTWERGVEAETLACGTGAVASAVVSQQLGLTNQPVTVMTSSGMPLKVAFETRAGAATRIELTGQTAMIAKGTLLAGAFS